MGEPNSLAPDPLAYTGFLSANAGHQPVGVYQGLRTTGLLIDDETRHQFYAQEGPY